MAAVSATRRHAARAPKIRTRAAIDPYRATDAAVCPDGKLEVGGAWSSRTTFGRGRWTTSVVMTKIVTSPTITATTNSGSRHLLNTSAAVTTTIAASTVTGSVDAASVA